MEENLSSLEMFRQMVLIRRFEEKSAELYTQERIRGFLHLYIGEEAVAVGVMMALRNADSVVATYREHGHALARGISPARIMAEMYGKAEGVSRGRGGSMHLFDKSARFYGGNAIVAGGLPMAVGLALANQMQRTDNVVCCFFGEGAVAEGEFHESLNLAALWKLPIIFVCENNLYAMGTALERSESQTNLCCKASSYSLHAEDVDGMDIQAVANVASRLVDRVRSDSCPVFLECRTYRFRPHSMFDPELYRSKEEVARWQQRDPITLFAQVLRSATLLDDYSLQHIEESVEQQIAEAVAFAEAANRETTEDLMRFVYA
jgi:pyruvate dehydrogenase E1 component alpha subunit